MVRRHLLEAEVALLALLPEAVLPEAVLQEAEEAEVALLALLREAELRPGLERHHFRRLHHFRLLRRRLLWVVRLGEEAVLVAGTAP